MINDCLVNLSAVLHMPANHSTYGCGFMMLSSSSGEFGTRRTIILRPSVEPMPIDAKDLIDVASEISLPEPISLNTNELVRPIAAAAGKLT